MRAAPLLLACFIASAAFAQSNPFRRDIDLVPEKATPLLDSGIALEGAHLLPKHAFRLALLLDFDDGLLSLKLGDAKLGNLVPYRLDAHLMGSYQLLDWLEVGADLPLTVTQGDDFQLLRDSGFPEQGVSAAGPGDLRLLARASPFRHPLPLGIELAGTAELRLPTGDGKSFLGERGWLFAPRIALERAFGRLRLIGNLGLRLRMPAQYLNLYVSNELAAGVGVVFSLPDFWKIVHPQLVAEMHLSTPLSTPFTFNQADSLKTPWEVLAGVRAHLRGPWGAELDVGRGLTTSPGYGREALRVIAAVRFDLDQPPPAPARGESGDIDGDGVPDGVDLCRDVPGLKEFDGCPDTDGDQVPDNEDSCPEDFGPAENSGCPEKGPQVELEGDRIRIRGNILFDTGEATIERQSYPLLDQVAKLLTDHPEVGPVRVEGHTDNRGSRSFNLELSGKRARAVVGYLVKKGIDPKRLRAKGFGFEHPIASNATALGRAKNRRVDFTLVKRQK